MSGGSGGGGAGTADPRQGIPSVSRISSWRLDYFCSQHLQPQEEFLQQASRAVDRICDFLKTRCFQDAPQPGIKVLRGGSLGKGTSMKNGKTDLELFLNIFNLYREQAKDQKEVTEVMEKYVHKWQKSPFSPTIMEKLLENNNISRPRQKNLKTLMEETDRRIKEWQKQPYLSDADLQLLSNVFKSYTNEGNDWEKFMDLITKQSNNFFLSHNEQKQILDRVRTYTAKEKDRKKIITKTKRQVNNRQVKPYSSDADLVLFLDIFKSYTDQEKDRKVIIEEIERRLKEWQQEPYLPEVDVGLLLDLLKSYRDQGKNMEEITQKIKRWFCNCNVPEADLVPLHNLFERFLENEKDRRIFYEGIAMWRKAGQGERDLLNADLGLLLELIKRYTDKEQDQKRITEEDCKENMSLELIFEKSKWSNPRVLQFKLRSKKTEDFIDFDVLPAYDALGHYDGSMPNPQIYVDLIRTGKSGEFSPCFTELQKDFIKDQPTKLKSLICLVKHWYNEVQEKSFPPKYALELLTVYAWEQGSGKTVFNTAEGFRTVLWLIEHYKEIRIYWTEYYDFQNEIIKQYLQKQLCKTRPVILDPADPTANLGEAEGWDRLAEKARCYASMNCCQKRDAIHPPFPASETKLVRRRRNESQGSRWALAEGCVGSPPRCLAMDSLGRVGSWELDKRAGEEIDRICEFLKRRCFQDAPQPGIKVLKVVKENMRLELIFEKSKWSNPRVLQFKLRSKKKEDFIDFDVLPAYDALGHYDGSMPNPQIYVDLIHTGKSGEFSPCFTELQKDFIKDQPTKLKSLICLVKHWYNEVQEKSFPPKYALELLTVYACEQGSGNTVFNTAEGFRTVLWLIEHYKEIRIYWTKYYDFQNEIIKQYLQEQLCKTSWQRKCRGRKAGPISLCHEETLCGSETPGETKLVRRRRNESQGSRWALAEGCVGSPLRCLAMNFLGRVGSWELDKFHEDYLNPKEEFLRKARQAIDRICEFLKRRCFQDAPLRGIKVLKVVKEKDRKMIIEEIERQLNECQEVLNLEVFFEKSKWSNPRVLQFRLRSKESDDSIEFDVLPAYDTLGHYDRSMPNPQIYVDLIRTGKSGEFSPCFTELQKNFIVRRDTKLKSLIRLVKHWYNEVKEKSFPPKYALELLTVYAWEQGSGKTIFNTAEGFRTVLWLIEHYKEIRIYWTEYYDFQNEIIKQYLQKQLCKNRPVILDPADPTANFGEAKGWDRLAEKARCYASMNCCRKRDGSLVQPWDLAKEVPWEEGKLGIAWSGIVVERPGANENYA
ncbi:putative 2'5'-oligoadenylate synthetase 1 40-46kDa protein, partial [Naja naja]